MLARVPDTGSPVRDRQGPRTALPPSSIEQIRAMRKAGVAGADIARRFRVCTRTVARYVARPEDPLLAAIQAALDTAAAEGLEVSPMRVERTELAEAIARRLRARGLVR